MVRLCHQQMFVAKEIIKCVCVCVCVCVCNVLVTVLQFVSSLDSSVTAILNERLSRNMVLPLLRHFSSKLHQFKSNKVCCHCS
jgi:hypothetical protein